MKKIEIVFALLFSSFVIALINIIMLVAKKTTLFFNGFNNFDTFTRYILIFSVLLNLIGSIMNCIKIKEE